jgi:hypothetical protein
MFDYLVPQSRMKANIFMPSALRRCVKRRRDEFAQARVNSKSSTMFLRVVS